MKTIFFLPGSLAFGLAALLALLALESPTTPAQEPPGPGARLQGTAKIDRRNRVAGAVVRVRHEQDPSILYLTSTDEDGTFVLDGVSNGSYEVTLMRTGYRTVRKDKVSVRYPFRAVVEVTMVPTTEIPDRDRRGAATAASRTVRVGGRVVSRGAEPLEEIRVRLVHPRGALDPHDLRTDADGGFTVDEMAAGEWELGIEGVGYLPLYTNLDLQQDATIEIVLVQQPTDYQPGPLELMPREQLMPPASLQLPLPSIDARTAK